MRKTLTALAAGLLACAAAAPALAFTPGGMFDLNGTVVLSKPGLPLTLTCTAKFTVTSPTPVTPPPPPPGLAWPDGAISSVILTGGPLGACATVVATGLPWTLHAPAPYAAVQIGPVILNQSAFGACGPTTLTGAWSNAAPGSLTLTGASLGGCLTSWTLSANPAQTLP